MPSFLIHNTSFWAFPSPDSYRGYRIFVPRQGVVGIVQTCRAGFRVGLYAHTPRFAVGYPLQSLTRLPKWGDVIAFGNDRGTSSGKTASNQH